jgi:hypothetical protein
MEKLLISSNCIKHNKSPIEKQMQIGCGMRRAVFFMSRCGAYRDIKNTVAGERRTNAIHIRYSGGDRTTAAQ